MIDKTHYKNKLIHCYTFGDLHALSLFQLTNRDLLNISIIKNSCFSLGIGIDVDYENPIHIGISLGFINVFIQFFSVQSHLL